MNTMRSNIEWKQWGERDPLFAVYVWPGKSKEGPAPWSDEEFYQLGQSDWADFKRQWEQYGVEAGTCLEVGCGAGRITKQLATSFRSVKAVDVSEHMIAYARKNIQSANVEFFVTNGLNLPLPDNSVDAVFSSHVFQHFDTLADAARYLREISRVMVVGGSCMIHLPIYRWPNMSCLYSFIHRYRTLYSEIKAKYLRLLINQGKQKPLMRFLQYRIDWLCQELDRVGFGEVEFRIFRVRSNNLLHPFILARRIPLQETSTAKPGLLVSDFDRWYK